MSKINLNDVRYTLDFDFMPEMFYETPAQFFNALEQGKEGFLCNVFNNFYEGVNEKHFKNNPIVFKPEDFKITKYLLAKSKFLYYVEVPTPHDGAKVWCEAFCFGFDLKIAEESKLKYFTVENSELNVKMLCGVDSDKKHVNYGKAAADMENNVDKMLKIMFKN